MNRQCNDIFHQLESWYAGPRGQYLLDITRERLQGHLDTAFGYHILQLGPVRGAPLINASRINHQIFAGPAAGYSTGLISELHELPLASDSVDVIVAHHSLEFSSDPHQVLRELLRVLTPQGHLFIVGINPFSLKGTQLRLRSLSRTSVWSNHTPVSAGRLSDWLRLLVCDVRDTEYFYTVPPVGKGRIRNRLTAVDRWCNSRNLPLGGVYIMHAIKQVVAHNKPRNGLRTRSERLIGLVPKPKTAPSPGTPIRNPGMGSASQSQRR